MATINKQIAKDIMHTGKYADETQYIITYNNMFDGTLSYATIGWRQHPMIYHNSPACSNTKCIWKHPSAPNHPMGLFPEN